RIVRTPELLIVFSAGWAAMLAALCSALGFSNELGGLLAGVSLASTPYRETIVSRLAPLRDFLLLFFFIALGAQLEFSPLGAQLVPAALLSLFVLIGNPIIVMAIMGFMGYRKRTGFLAGLTVAQISEFSLILMAMGMKMEHTTKDALSLVTLVGLVTIAVSIYMITYSQELYNWLEPYLGIFERKNPYSEVALEMKRVEKKRYDIILFGLGRYGGAIAEQLLKEEKKILGIDYDPEAVRRWRRRGLDAMHGDAWDHDLIASLKLHDVRWVVSALPQFEFSIVHEDPRLILIDNLRQAGRFSGKIAVSTRSPEEIRQLELKGADIVFLPFYDAAARAVERMREMDADAKLS
ncbi:MAG: cation:proton antiporter, partial [Chlamydiia bacterium]|nr:cation:proton antiporter [Chlamydiia bacterium]